MKVIRGYIDYGFGFPVEIDHVQVLPDPEGEIPLIDYPKLRTRVLSALVEKRGRLTGNEVRFVRLVMEKTLENFGELFDVSHAAVKKWESHADGPTAMNWATETLLRVRILLWLGGASEHVVRFLDRIAHSPVDSLETREEPLRIAMPLYSKQVMTGKKGNMEPGKWPKRGVKTCVR